MARIGATLLCLLAVGFGLAAGGVTTSSVTMGKATVTSSSTSSSASTDSSSASSKASHTSGKPPQHPKPMKHPKSPKPPKPSKPMKHPKPPQPPKPPPQASVTRLVQEWPITNGQAVKTTQIISGPGISGVIETVQVTRAKKEKQFSSTSTTQIGNAPPVTTVTSSSKDGSRVTVGQGKDKFRLKALPPIDFDVKGFFKMDVFKSSKSENQDEDPLELNAQIDIVTKMFDHTFQTTYNAADNEFNKKKQDAKTTFSEASNKFRELGLKYPDLDNLAY